MDDASPVDATLVDATSSIDVGPIADVSPPGGDALTDGASFMPDGADALVDTGADSVRLTPSSCLEARNAGATRDGLYQIDADGSAGPLPALEVYCDMTFDGGGWTLVQSYDGTNVPQNFVADDGVSLTLNAAPRPAVFGSFGRKLLDPLIANITQIHVRRSFVVDAQNADATSGWWVTSSPSPNGQATVPVANLRAHRLLNDGTNGSAADWTGPRVANLLWSPSAACTLSARAFPSVYWACNNGNGLHLVADAARWDYAAKVQDPMEVYVR